MKTALLLFVSALTALGQLTNIPSNWSPKDSLPYINNNFTYLNTYKTGLSSCGPGQFGIQTATNGLVCSTVSYLMLSNVPTAFPPGAHQHSTDDLISGKLGFLRGGTNQNTWTAGRCVRVKNDGTALESASGDCGAGGGGMVDPTTTQGDFIYRSNSGTTRLPLGANGYSLLSNGTDAVWGRVSYLNLTDVPVAFAPTAHASAHGAASTDPLTGLLASQIALAARQGDSTKFQMFGGGAVANNDCAKFDSNGNLISSGAACGTGQGGAASVGSDGAMQVSDGAGAFGNSGCSATRGSGILLCPGGFNSGSGVYPIPAPSSATPLMNGGATAGASTNYAREGHIHPVDTSRAASNASTQVNGVACALGSACTVADATKVPVATTVNGHPLSSNINVTVADLNLNNVTNDAQLKAADLVTSVGTPGSATKVPSESAVRSAIAAVAAHTQNTDTGTTQAGFQVDSGNSGPRIKNNAGTLEVRNAADAALAPMRAASATYGDGTVAGEWAMYELAANGVNYISWLVPDLIAANLRLKFPNAVPTAGQAMAFGAPSSNISQISWFTPVDLDSAQTLTNKGIDGASATEVSYLVGVTGGIQGQINGRAASNASTTVNGQVCTLGGTCTITVGATAPTGTGFPHVTGGSYDVAARTLLVSDLPGEYICTSAASSGTTYACTPTTAPAAYVTGESYSFIADAANTGAATANFNSLGAKTIKKVAGGITTDVAANDIRAGQIVNLRYDGTNFQMASQLGNSTGMVYPGAGIAVSSGGAWGTSLTAPASAIVGLTDTQSLTNKTLDGVTPTTMSYVDPTSSIQTQLNGKMGTGASVTAAQMPALTGDVTTTAGTVATTVVKINGVTLSGLATGILKNTTGTGVPSIAAAADLPAHASRHQNGGNDEIAVAAGAANAIPKAGAGGQLAASWMPALTGDVTTTAGAVATTVVKLNGVTLSGLGTGILKNTTGTGVPSIAAAADLPAHASRHQNGGNDEIAVAAGAANAIPKAGAGGQLAASWLPALTGDITTSAGAAATTIANGVVTPTKASAALNTDTWTFNLGVDNASADLVAADIGPQGRILMVPVACTISEVTVAANAGTPSVIIRKNHAGTQTNLVSGTLATGASGAVACAATGAACADGTSKSGTVTIVTTSSTNVLAAGDWIETTSGVASSGAKRLSVAVTCVRN